MKIDQHKLIPRLMRNGVSTIRNFLDKTLNRILVYQRSSTSRGARRALSENKRMLGNKPAIAPKQVNPTTTITAA